MTTLEGFVGRIRDYGLVGCDGAIKTVHKCIQAAQDAKRAYVLGINGGPGSGKSCLLDAIINSLTERPHHKFSSTAVFSHRQAFQKRAMEEQLSKDVFLYVIDDFCFTDPLLVSRLDEFIFFCKYVNEKPMVIVLAAVTLPDSVNEYIDANINLYLEPATRLAIINQLSSEFKYSKELAAITNAYGYYDLRDLLLDNPCPVDLPSIRAYMLEHRPIALRDLEQFAGVSATSDPIAAQSLSEYTLDRLGGMEEAIMCGKTVLIDPWVDREAWKKAGLTAPKGLLIWGLSGCGKTHLALALARASELAFLQIDAASLRSKYLGETEKRIAAIFNQARSLSPCILIFDHLEGLLPHRHSHSFSSTTDERIVTCFLTEMDGVLSAHGREVIVVGLSIDKSLIDQAMLRPGRIGVHIQLDVPKGSESRKKVIECLLKRFNHQVPVDFISRCSNEWIDLTPAEMLGIIERSCLRAVRLGRDVLLQEDFIWP